MVRRWFCGVVLGISLVLVTGCPSDFEQLEALYFDDNYIQTVILAAEMVDQRRDKKRLGVFYQQNGLQLEKRLVETLVDFANQPTKSDLQLVQQLCEATKVLFDKNIGVSATFNQFVVGQMTVIEQVFLQQQAQLVNEFLQAFKFRRALETLYDIALFTPLTLQQQQVLDRLQAYVPRQLAVNTIKVHDEDITKLKTIAAADQLDYYDSKGQLLIEESVNIPKEFGRHLNHYLKKQSSDYLSLVNKSATKAAHYRVDVSVGYTKRVDVFETKQLVNDYFNVKFMGDDYWHAQPVTYELFTQTTTYVASVQAVVYLNETNRFLSQHVFEVLVPVAVERTGELVDLHVDIVEFEYSKKYKQYQVPAVLKPEYEYIQDACNDAASVLAVHVLNVIDIEPEPFALAFPL